MALREICRCLASLRLLDAVHDLAIVVDMRPINMVEIASTLVNDVEAYGRLTNHC